jgi:hypothetical protein
MASKNTTKTPADLPALADELDRLQEQAAALGAEVTARKIGYAAKSARHVAKQSATRTKRLGGLVAEMQGKGMTPEEIVAALTAAPANGKAEE